MWPWAYFDEASQNNICGGGAILLLTKNHYYKIHMVLEHNTNNFAKLFASKKSLSKHLYNM